MAVHHFAIPLLKGSAGEAPPVQVIQFFLGTLKDLRVSKLLVTSSHVPLPATLGIM